MIRKWPVKQSRELHSKSKFLVTAEAYSFHIFSQNISDIFEYVFIGHPQSVRGKKSYKMSVIWINVSETLGETSVSLVSPVVTPLIKEKQSGSLIWREIRNVANPSLAALCQNAIKHFGQIGWQESALQIQSYLTEK